MVEDRVCKEDGGGAGKGWYLKGQRDEKRTPCEAVSLGIVISVNKGPCWRGQYENELRVECEGRDVVSGDIINGDKLGIECTDRLRYGNVRNECPSLLPPLALSPLV